MFLPANLRVSVTDIFPWLAAAIAETAAFAAAIAAAATEVSSFEVETYLSRQHSSHETYLSIGDASSTICSALNEGAHPACAFADLAIARQLACRLWCWLHGTCPSSICCPAGFQL